MYGAVLEKQEIQLEYGNGGFQVRYYQQVFTEQEKFGRATGSYRAPGTQPRPQERDPSARRTPRRGAGRRTARPAASPTSTPTAVPVVPPLFVLFPLIAST